MFYGRYCIFIISICLMTLIEVVARPSIELAPFDVLDVMSDHITEVEFTVENTYADIEIKNVRVSCGCIQLEVQEKQINKGELIRGVLKIRALSTSMIQKETIVFEPINEELAVLILPIRLHFKPQIQASPKVLDFGNIIIDALPLARNLHVTFPSEIDINAITATFVNKTNVTGEVLTQKLNLDQNSIFYRIIIKTCEDAGYQDAHILIFDNQSENKVAEIPVRIFRESHFRSNPKNVFLIYRNSDLEVNEHYLSIHSEKIPGFLIEKVTLYPDVLANKVNVEFKEKHILFKPKKNENTNFLNGYIRCLIIANNEKYIFNINVNYLHVHR